MASPVVEVLALLGAGFERLGVRWYLFGGQAAILHGISRLTADVDVTVEIGDRPARDLVAVLAGSGFDLRAKDADGFVARTRVLPMVHRSSRIPVDLVLAGPGLEELFLDRAVVRVVDGVRVRVASAEDVVAMKILAGRHQDLEDAAGILRAQGSAFRLDMARDTLRLLERALDRSDLLPDLDRAATRGRG